MAAVAHAAAGFIAARARAAVAARGRFLIAVSGGRTPWRMLRELAAEDLPWHGVHVYQVDERIAPAGDPARNFTHLQASLLAHAPLRATQVHPMPVEAPDLAAACDRYAADLAEQAGTPPVLDLVHLGLGADGHTASLMPDDAVLDVLDRDVALCGPHLGWPRMTLTLPLIDRARGVLWVVTGADKARALARLRGGDRTIPAGRIARRNARVIADRAAAGEPDLNL